MIDGWRKQDRDGVCQRNQEESQKMFQTGPGDATTWIPLSSIVLITAGWPNTSRRLIPLSRPYVCKKKESIIPDVIT